MCRLSAKLAIFLQSFDYGSVRGHVNTKAGDKLSVIYVYLLHSLGLSLISYFKGELSFCFKQTLS